MRPCIHGIWPALVRANKYSKARNREARRGEARRAVPLFPPYGVRFLNHNSSRERAYRDACALVCTHRASLFAPQRGLSRINSRRQESRTIGHGGYDAAYLVRSHLACNNEIAASKRASKRGDRVRRIPVFAVNRVRNNNICKRLVVCVRYRRFPSLRISLLLFTTRRK